METYLIHCDACGKYIPIADIETGAASHKLLTPDSDFSPEKYESICKKCLYLESILEKSS